MDEIEKTVGCELPLEDLIERLAITPNSIYEIDLIDANDVIPEIKLMVRRKAERK